MLSVRARRRFRQVRWVCDRMSDQDSLPEDGLPECHEGPEAFERFDATMSAFLAVPKSLVVRRQRAYRKKLDAKPTHPGPKRKSERPPFDN
jgi:hypothetical protein